MASHKAVLTDDLVRRSVDGDRAAQDELAAACLTQVWRTVYLCSGGGPDVEDLVQTAVVRALTKLPSYRPEGKFPAWLDRVTINVVRQHYRRRKLWLGIVDTLRRTPAPRPDSEATDRRAESRRVLARLAAHMAALRPKYRHAVALSIVRDYSVRDIAEACDCSVEAAKKRLARGRRDLIARLRRDPYCDQIAKELLR